MAKKHKDNKALPPLKRFIIRKYIMASCVSEALKLENNMEPDDCYLDDEWIKSHPEIKSRERISDSIGFIAPQEE